LFPFPTYAVDRTTHSKHLSFGGLMFEGCRPSRDFDLAQLEELEGFSDPTF